VKRPNEARHLELAPAVRGDAQQQLGELSEGQLGVRVLQGQGQG
jgi:hypothetical protein